MQFCGGRIIINRNIEQRPVGCNGRSARLWGYIREWGKAAVQIPALTNTVGIEIPIRWRKPVIGAT